MSDTVSGKFAITWVRYDMPPDDAVPEYNVNPRVMAQVFTDASVPVTSEFDVPSDPYSITSEAPDVAMATDGTFVVTWQGPNVDYSTAINARMYDANGTPLADQFTVNTLGVGTYYTPAITMRSNKNFVIVWRQYRASTDSTIQGRRFDATGTKLGSEIKITGNDGYARMYPDVDVADTSGNFVVTWTADQLDTSQHGVYYARFNSSGTKLTADIQVNTTTINNQERSRVSMNPAGLYVIVWYDDNGNDTYGRRYTATGTASSVFTVNGAGTVALYPDVALDRDGNFIVVWQGYDDDPITHDFGIWGRQYAANGTAVATQFCVNNPGLAGRAIDNQLTPSVSRKAGSGEAVVVWTGYHGIAPSGGTYGIWHTKVVGSPAPTIVVTMTAPLSGSYAHGTVIPVSWNLTGAQAGATVNLFYSTGPNGTGTVYYISIGEIAAVNGSSSWNWDTATRPVDGAQPGTYYIGAYYWNGSATNGFGSTPFIIT